MYYEYYICEFTRRNGTKVREVRKRAVYTAEELDRKKTRAKLRRKYSDCDFETFRCHQSERDILDAINEYIENDRDLMW